MTATDAREPDQPGQNIDQDAGQAAGRTTASADQVERFTAIAEAWWDPAGKFRPLHRINPVRIAYIRDHAVAHFGRDPVSEPPLAGLRLLDIGCGGGLLCEPMSRLGAAVTGIDAGGKNIAIARRHAEQSGLSIDYRHVLPENMTDQRGGAGADFDIVLNMEVIEHVADVDAFLRASASLLRPGGVMFLSTINRTFKALALAKIGAEYILRWLPIGAHDWRKFVKPSELRRGLRRHGIELTDLAGIAYNPLADEWALAAADLRVNYLAMALKP